MHLLLKGLYAIIIKEKKIFLNLKKVEDRIMNLFEILLNLFVGICGGIFSSVIVSRIFLIQSRQDNQFEEIRLMRDKVLYLRIELNVYVDLIDKKEMLKAEEENQRLNELTYKYIQFLENCDTFFKLFDIEQADQEMCDIAHAFGIAERKKKEFIPLSYEKAKLLHESLGRLQDCVREYEKNKTKYLMKRLIKDIFLRILAVIFIVIIVLMIIAY